MYCLVYRFHLFILCHFQTVFFYIFCYFVTYIAAFSFFSALYAKNPCGYFIDPQGFLLFLLNFFYYLSFDAFSALDVWTRSS